jgi:basic amino acid/polyamine antiporter, APA family
VKQTKAEPGIERASSGLLPTLGLFTTVMLVVGGVIGSGIFRKPGLMAHELGSPALVLLVWAAAGAITFIGALTNAEIAAMIPETGGQYVYFERMYGPFVAFLYGWAVFAVIQTGSIAAIAYVFAEYSTQFIALPEWSGAAATWSFHLWGIGDIVPLKEAGIKMLAAGLVILLTGINYLGVKFGGLVQNVFTIAKVTAMGLLVLAAFLVPHAGQPANLVSTSAIHQPHGFLLLGALAAALQAAFWAYDGWNKVSYIAGEIKEPQRNIPRALALGMMMVTAVYLIINAAYAYVLPVDEMAASRLVAADVAERCFRGGGKWIALTVMISTFGAVNATILATARVYFTMAKRGVFPAFLGRAHPRLHTPGASLIVQGIWSILLLLSGTFDALTDTLIFVTWIFYAASAYGVFVLRRREPGTPRPYKVPGYPFLPWVFIIFALLFLGLALANDISQYQAARRAGKPGMINAVFGCALVLAGTPIYFFFRRGHTNRGARVCACIPAFLFSVLVLSLPARASAAGVTLITHGFSSDVNSWVTAMADSIPKYATFNGTNFTTYKIAVTYSSGNYVFTTTRTNGTAPAASDSGEIIVKLDWSALAGSSPQFSTYAVGNAVARALAQTNLISELGGHALTELPLHLIGHSRGGSLISEISRDLGTNGIWVDQLTTLDPHPLNNDGNNDWPLTVVDAPVHTYVNVLFHDNYWQNMGDGLFVPNGEPVAGAYVRQLFNLSGGYSSSHSDVHLWYHGTINWATPASDTGASITSTERTNWWSTYESRGTVAGFLYSLVGGGNRLSPDQPFGAGYSSIRNGFNQYWDLGAGVQANRTMLPSNSGTWPNLVRLDRTDTNAVLQGQSAGLKLYYQWAQPTSAAAALSIYLDDDVNPLNTNQQLLQQTTLSGTGAGNVLAVSMQVPLNATNSSPGKHWLWARLTGGSQTRLLYAPEPITILPPQAPHLDITRISPGEVAVGISGMPGQTIVLQTAEDLQTWQPALTNTLASTRWVVTNSTSGSERKFYRALTRF